MFDIPENRLPAVRSSSEIYGHTENILMAAPVPVSGIAGDQQSALSGQMCTQPGMIKNTYGTGSGYRYRDQLQVVAGSRIIWFIMIFRGYCQSYR